MRQRAAAKRTWIKMYPMPCLFGSIRWQLTAEERGTWYDLLNMAGISVFPGFICDSDHRPIPHEALARQLNISQELFDTTLKKCNAEGRTKENKHGIQIVNWAAYQAKWEKKEDKKGIDPDKYVRGKYKHIVQR